MPDNQTPSFGVVPAVTDPSKFCVDHADYAGMTDSQKRRRITRLLRQCNVFVLAEQVSVRDINGVRANVENAQTWAGAGTNAIHEGIIWVRCPQPGFYDDKTGGTIRQGWPVIFDISTGNSVTGWPSYNDSFSSWHVGSVYPQRPLERFNLDEYVIVGYAMAAPVKNANSDFWQVPIRLHRQWDQPQGKFYATGWSTDYLYYPNPRVSNNHRPVTQPLIEPAVDLYTPSWAEMVIKSWQLSHQASDPKYKMELGQIAEYGVVINPYPWAWSSYNDGDLVAVEVVRSGDVFVVTGSSNQEYSGTPITTLTWNSSGTYNTGTQDLDLGSGFGPTNSQSPLIRTAGVNVWRWLPTFKWRYRLTGYIDIWTNGGLTSYATNFPTPELVLGHFGVPFSTGTPTSLGYTLKAYGSTPDAPVYMNGNLFTLANGYRVPISCVIDIDASETTFPALLKNMPVYNDSSNVGYSSGHLTIEPIY